MIANIHINTNLCQLSQSGFGHYILFLISGLVYVHFQLQCYLNTAFDCPLGGGVNGGGILLLCFLKKDKEKEMSVKCRPIELGTFLATSSSQSNSYLSPCT